MENAWQRYVELATGATQVTRKRAEQVVRTLVKRGEVAAERAEKTVDELLKRSEMNRKLMSAAVRTETEKAVARLGLARQRDVERLERKVAELERRATGATGTTARTVKKSAKKTTRKAAKKAPARKASAKKTTARKATKRAAKKTSGS